MGIQNEIKKSSNLFNKDGSLVQKGWARKPILNYNKEYIGKGWSRIKEWDHYSIFYLNSPLTMNDPEMDI